MNSDSGESVLPKTRMIEEACKIADGEALNFNFSESATWFKARGLQALGSGGVGLCV